MMKHAYRIMILLGGAALMLGWVIKHSEPSSNVGLRDIHQAEQLDRGAWREGLFRGIDHPLHPLLIVGGARPDRWQHIRLVAAGGAGALLYMRHSACHSDLPAGARAFWRRDGVACLPADDRQSDHRIHRLERPLGEHVPALVDIRPVGRCSVLARRAVPLAPAGDRLRSTRLPDASGRNALAGRAGGDLADLARVAGDADQLAAMVAGPGVSGGRAGVSGRAVHRTEGGPGNQAADRTGAGTGGAGRSRWPWSAKPRFPLARRRSNATRSPPSGCSRSSAMA